MWKNEKKNRELYIADTRHQLSFEQMVEKVEQAAYKTTYHYNKDYICGKTIQYEIFDGIWIVYHDLILKVSELFPLEEIGFIEMNYCIAGRCESDYENHRVFYVGPGDFAAALLANEQHKHNFPLGNYKGISITTTEDRLDSFLKAIFGNTKITSSMFIEKIKEYGKYMLLSNDLRIQNIMKDIIIPGDSFWTERAKLKFGELLLVLLNDDIEASENRSKYFDRDLVDRVKLIKKEITENAESYITIEEIAHKYNISSRAFSECFKEIYGKTYYSFIKEFRIKKAASMLCKTDYNIRDIAITVGYQNASKFSKAFSDIMGVTPICFRKNNSITVLEQK